MLPALYSRWGQLVLGIICMVMIANLQYGWTLFVLPIDQAQHWGRAAIQVAFTVFVICETWLLPLEGYVIDRIGPRLTVGAGGLLIGASWVLNSLAGSLILLYVAAAVGGVGAGFIYGATVGNAIKWFPDRRGLAAGLTAAGFGAGSAVTVVPISNMIASQGYQATFLFFGLLQGIVVVLVAAVLRPPPGQQAAREAFVTPSGMLATCTTSPATTRPARSRGSRCFGSCTSCSCWWARAGWSPPPSFRSSPPTSAWLRHR